MAFTALDVKKLREMTNVGMMDCKAALQATDGDMDKAVDWLREKGLAKAAKKAGRIAAEGLAYASVIDGVGVVIEVNSETDFAAKTDKFLDLVKSLSEIVAKDAPADVEALKACTYPGTNLTVTEKMQELVMSIGENMQIRRFARFAENTSVAYVHAGGSHGVLVNLAVEGDIDATEIGKNVAMQIAAMKAQYWDKSLVPQEVVPATDHDWDDGVITREPTAEKEGEKTYTCKNNSEHKKYEAVPYVAPEKDYDDVPIMRQSPQDLHSKVLLDNERSGGEKNGRA